MCCQATGETFSSETNRSDLHGYAQLGVFSGPTVDESAISVGQMKILTKLF